MSKLTLSCGLRGRGGGSSESSDACGLEEIICNVIQFCVVCTVMNTIQDVLKCIILCT